MFCGFRVRKIVRSNVLFQSSKNVSNLKKEKQKILSSEKALEHFDDFYKPLFQKNWPSIRLGLLTHRKYIAALNNFSDIEATQTTLENQGAINVQKLFEVQNSRINGRKRRNKETNYGELESTLAEISEKKLKEEYDELYANNSNGPSKQNEMSDRYIDPSVSVSQLYEYIPATELKGSDDWIRESSHFSYYSSEGDQTVKILSDNSLLFPENLHIYSFEPGNPEMFPPPKKGSTGVSNYFLLDGGSLLPVLALNIQPGDQVLDMCAAPGGKSFLTFQTLYPKSLVCNDISESRVNRIWKMLKEFIYDCNSRIKKGEISVTLQDARTIDTPGLYNKILVDVPCTTDRHSVTEDDNNIFKSSRMKERIRLPELQSELLASALRLVSVGGTVVYSTCSLSPIQNDGVVYMALQKVGEESNSQFVVFDMTKALEPTKILFKFGNIGLRYGHLIVPFIVNNFGPTYFCKIMRVR